MAAALIAAALALPPGAEWLPSHALASGGSNGPSTSGGPRRVIVLSHGRGGSTMLCTMLADFAHSDPHELKKELFGKDEVSMGSKDNPAGLMASWFDRQSLAQPQAHLVGFKWKPFLKSEPLYLDAWSWAASHDVRVLWLRRNPLDVLISRAKHLADDGLPDHCEPGDSACLDAHARAKAPLDASTLVADLEAYVKDYEDELPALLKARGVRFHPVRFEDLVAGEQSTASASKARALDSWNAALTFVGEAPLHSYAELERAFWAAGVTDTSPGTQCDALQDPDGVSAALRGTRFEALLTC